MDDKLETMELGIQNTQEEIHLSGLEYTTALDRAVNRIQEEFAGLSQQLTTALSMFAW